MSDFYTRTGDDGNTGLLGKGRVPKYHPVPQAVGALDEANAALGVARAACRDVQSAPILLQAQRDLYHLMAEVAATPENVTRFRAIDGQSVAWLEEQIAVIENQIEMPTEFIIPGDSPASAALSLARSIVRRAERHVAQLYHAGQIENSYLLSYLNRLSSLCFALEILEVRSSGIDAPTLAR